MSKVIGILLVLIVTGCTSGAPAADNEELGYKGHKRSGSPVPKAIQVLNSLKENPNAEFRESQGWIIVHVDSDEEKSLYSFTPKDHPAYPSIVKREVIEKDGSIYIDTSADCGATKDVCDELVRDFLDLNNRVREEVQR